jgi:hypothetical protein
MNKIFKLSNMYNIMKIKTVMVILLLFILLPIPMISAAKYVKQSEDVTLTLPCIVQGNYCSASAICNTTIVDPNNLILLNGITMTRNGAMFEINLTAAQTSVLGEYQFNVACVDGSRSGSRFLKFYSTPTGDGRGLGLFLILAFASLITFVTAVTLRNEYLGFISGSLFIVAGVYTMIYGISNLADVYTRSMSYIFLAIGVFSVLVSGIELIAGIESGGSQPTEELYDYFTESD